MKLRTAADLERRPVALLPDRFAGLQVQTADHFVLALSAMLPDAAIGNERRAVAGPHVDLPLLYELIGPGGGRLISLNDAGSLWTKPAGPFGVRRSGRGDTAEEGGGDEREAACVGGRHRRAFRAWVPGGRIGAGGLAGPVDPSYGLVPSWEVPPPVEATGSSWSSLSSRGHANRPGRFRCRPAPRCRPA